MTLTRTKIAAVLVAAGLTLVACGSDDAGSSKETTSSADANAQRISIEDNHGTQQVPMKPTKIASTDNRTFEILDKWGVDLVAAPKQIVPKTLPNIRNNDDIKDMGSHREPNMEALVAAQPDLIINGQRFKTKYDEIKKLNPQAAIVEFEPRDGESLDKELKRETEAMGKIFGKEAEAKALVDDFDKAIERAKKAYDPKKKVMAINVSGGEMGYVAPGKGRFFGPIFDWLKLTPALEVANASDDHQGDDISVEAIANSKPDVMLVMDRDAAISAAEEPGYKPAADVLKGADALKNVPAVKNDVVVFAPEDTYVNEGIITYTEMLNAIADAFEKA
ncbi:siderophore ABC transporter substrate-binding protein [Corynebacterium auriscanis]|uniref:siderophore ABC transporter substrate-binding protein n=1 Tax=Corynebacterium auriscanis TaxID=99807 RepID=UPI003CFB99A6